MTEKYFFGGAAPNGFLTYLSELVNDTEYYTYILKGGPGTGKSTLMKRIAQCFEKKEHVVYYYCSFDPDSLDAIVLTESRVIILDGTPPHIFEPKYPGVCQRMINLGEYLNESVLKEKREEIISVIDLKKSLMSGTAENNRVLGTACRERYDRALECVDKGKIEEAADDFCSKLFRAKREHKGKKSIRQLSVMTRYGYMTRTDTVSNYSKVFILNDDMFAASDIFIDIVAGRAIENGYDIKLSPCILFGSFEREHLLIDELDVALITSDPLTHITDLAGDKIECSDFYKRESIRQNEAYLEDNKTKIEDLTDRSKQMLDEAKRVHDETEKYYINAMDFASLEGLYKDICKEIASS